METNDRYGNYRKSVRQFPFLGRKYAGPIWILQFLEPWSEDILSDDGADNSAENKQEAVTASDEELMASC